MKVTSLTVLVLALMAPQLVSAQGEGTHSGQGYVFFAPGAIVSNGTSTGTFEIGGGAEGFLYRGLAVGAELGYLAPWRARGDGIGLLSADGSYHFSRGSRVSSFLTGGYSLAFRSGSANAINFGGGANLWVSGHTGSRLEFRDHIEPRYTDTHYLGSDRVCVTLSLRHSTETPFAGGSRQCDADAHRDRSG